MTALKGTGIRTLGPSLPEMEILGRSKGRSQRLTFLRGPAVQSPFLHRRVHFPRESGGRTERSGRSPPRRHRPCSRVCRGYSAQAAADRLYQQTDRRRRSPLTTRIRCSVEQWRARSSVSSGPLLAVELKNGNAPKFRERFDVRTVTFDVPIRPPFAPSPEVAQSRPWCRS
jgi:hypothetical protein